MKALSLSQPFATLIAIGAKRIETRSWLTRYRGRLAIHAAQGFPQEARDLCGQAHFQRVLARHNYLPAAPSGRPLPRGAVVAIVNVTDCLYTQAFRDHAPSRALLNPQEEAFGDFGPGRYGWVLELVEMLSVPVPAKGSLGLWEWEPPSELEAYRKEP